MNNDQSTFLRTATRTLIALGVATTLTLAACGDDDDSDAAPGTNAPTATAPATSRATTAPTTAGSESPLASGEAVITIEGFAFSGVTEVAAGTTVTVTNKDSAPHTWTASDGSFDSGSIAPGESFEFTLDTPGTYAFACSFHPSMTGTITVTG